MIEYVTGKLISKAKSKAVVETNGLGYALYISDNSYQALPEAGQNVKLLSYYYHTQQADQPILFGFASAAERDLFMILISVSGIGAKGAIKILSGISPERFMEVIAAENVDFLTKLPGIGKKTAQRIIVELREKLPALTSDKKSVPGLKREETEAVIQALSSLGMSAYESRKALEKLADNMGANKLSKLNTEELIREVLKGAI